MTQLITQLICKTWNFDSNFLFESDVSRSHFEYSLNSNLLDALEIQNASQIFKLMTYNKRLISHKYSTNNEVQTTWN